MAGENAKCYAVHKQLQLLYCENIEHAKIDTVALSL